MSELASSPVSSTRDLKWFQSTSLSPVQTHARCGLSDVNAPQTLLLSPGSSGTIVAPYFSQEENTAELDLVESSSSNVPASVRKVFEGQDRSLSAPELRVPSAVVSEPNTSPVKESETPSPRVMDSPQPGQHMQSGEAVHHDSHYVLVVGPSSSNVATVTIPAGFQCPPEVSQASGVENGHEIERFSLSQNGTTVTVQRLDSSRGWSMELRILCTAAAANPQPQQHEQQRQHAFTSEASADAADSQQQRQAEPVEQSSSSRSPNNLKRQGGAEPDRAAESDSAVTMGDTEPSAASPPEEDVAHANPMGPEDADSVSDLARPVPGSSHRRPMSMLRKLSVDLLQTYKHINEVYYANKKRRSAQSSRESQHKKERKELFNDGFDDEHHDYIVQENDVFNDRYEIDRVIGRGSFGVVVKGYDRLTKEHVAIKIIKNKEEFEKQAQVELRLLASLQDEQLCERFHVVKLKDHFKHCNHQCLVFELLSCNLYELIKNTNFIGVSLCLVRKFAIQILMCLFALQQPQIDIIHCDLKPENILLRHPRRILLKVVDFGSSCKSSDPPFSYVQSRFYRSPEILLGLRYGLAIDMWSLGCILVELHTGEPLFSGIDESDQLLKIIEVLGFPPVNLLKQARKAPKYFNYVPRDNNSNTGPEWLLKLPNPSSSRRKFMGAGRRILADIVKVRAGERSQDDEQSYTYFIDLVQSMLKWKAEERISPLAALNHPFFTAYNDRGASSSTAPSGFEGRQQTTSAQATGPMLSDRSIRSMEDSDAGAKANGPMSDRSIRSMEEAGVSARAVGSDSVRTAEGNDPMEITPHSPDGASAKQPTHSSSPPKQDQAIQVDLT